jgi:CheY-like chemotaxis protein
LNSIVLVIDDKDEIVETWKDAFETKGAKVLTASNGDDGIAILESDPVDIVVTDLMMPGSDGYVVLEFLKSMNPAPKTVVCSANSDVDKNKLKNYSIDHITPKPFSVDYEVDKILDLL